MKYVVTYVHLVEHTYDAIVEADSYEEAQRKIEDDMDFISEEELDWQGVSIEVIEVDNMLDYETETIECSECGELKDVEIGTWALEKGMCEKCFCIYQGG